MKNIFDMKHVKMVKAICLLKDGKEAGKIIGHWSDNPNGSVCTAQVILWNDDRVKKVKEKIGESVCEFDAVMIGSAGGYGYDKFSAAIESALRKGDMLEHIKVKGGSGNERNAFQDAGYTWIGVI